ncbi:MAG: ATP-binding cassette domain-containing protein, partial [Candidatus Sulfotelmatobacter sp.]
MSVLLEVRGVSKRFGGLVAVSDVSFSIAEGEIVGLIGPNGAGKTTLFNVVNGVYKADQGTIIFAGRDITRSSPD